MYKEFIPKTREPIVHGDLCYILLSDGSVAFCDAADYPLVSAKKIWTSSCGYAVFRDGSKSTKPLVFLHQVLNPSWEMTDHINRNKLDNRRCNLRACTHSQNDRNKPGKGGTSAFKGVSWDKSRRKWKVQIYYEGRNRVVGRFHDEIEAAKVYDAKARELYGEFAFLNFPEVLV